MVIKSNAKRINKLGLLTLAILINTFTVIFAYQPEFWYLQATDGLIDNNINFIAQDEDGIIWLATPTGLISYDGFNLNNYRPELGNPQSLPDKQITRLFVDSKNNLWIVAGKYLCRYDKSTDSFLISSFENRIENGVTIINLAQSGENLLVHAEDGFYIIPFDQMNDPEYSAKKISVFQSGQPVSNIFNYAFAFYNDLYLVSNYIKPGSAVIYKASLQAEGNNAHLIVQILAELEDNTANYLEYASPQNTLYIATHKGIYSYLLNQDKLIKQPLYSGTDIRILEYTSNNKLYLSTRGPELSYINLHTGKPGKYIQNPLQSGTLLNSNVSCLFEDFSGNLWVGHEGSGVSIMNLYRKEFRTFRQDPFSEYSMTSGNVTAIGGNDSVIFTGFRYGGMNYTDKDPDNFESVRFMEVKLKHNNGPVNFSESVWDIKRTSESEFLVGSEVGLLKLYREPAGWILEPFSTSTPLNRAVRKIMIDDNNNIWCGIADEGLILIPNPEINRSGNYYRYESDPYDETTLSDNTITSMIIDSKGRFWLGTLNGINLLKGKYANIDLSGNQRPDLTFKRYVAVTKSDDFLNNNEINCIHENFDGNIWFATQGGGINIYNPDSDIFSHLTTEEGLPANYVSGILPDKMGKLWISTTKGLVIYNHHSENPSFNYFTKNDGLQGDRFNRNSFFKSQDGEMFFGGELGFTRFFPQHIKPNEIEPKLAFTELAFDNKTAGIGEMVLGRQILEKHINRTEEIVLPFKHRNFSIGVAAIHYQNPDGNKIQYKLQGYDKKWRTIPAFYRNIYYSNLPPGKYTLKVNAINSNNIRSGESRLLAINVLSPWYLMWYTILIVCALVVLIISGLMLIILNRQKMLYDKKIDKLSIENAESKITLLYNIAHGIKTPLSLVLAPIDDIIQNYRDINPEWKSQLFLIQRNASYLSKLVNQIIDIRKIPAGKLKLLKQQTDIVRLIKDVVLNFNSFESCRGIKINVDIPCDKLLISIDPQKIEETLYNIISNAFKHTPANHNINIGLQIVDTITPLNGSSSKQLKITIFNEGEPIKEKYINKIFERFYKIDETTEGTGIGLPFSKSLVELHGGKIEVEPIPGKGMAFHILLPFQDLKEEGAGVIDKSLPVNPDEETFKPAEEEGYNNEPVESDEKQLKLVLVEDNDELRIFLKKALSKDYACYEASNGDEALQLINKIIPDIVISDIIMPEKDGFELCKNIKDNTNTCHIPVILLSAKNMQQQIISGYDVGADVYVTKPFDINIIKSQISRLIKNRELIRKKYIDRNFMVEVSGAELSKDDEFFRSFTDILKKNTTDPDFSVKILAGTLNVSPTQLYRKIKALTGYSPVEFIKILKLQKSYELLLDRKTSVKEVCYQSGFNNISYFIKCFRNHFGITPAQLRDKGTINESKARFGNSSFQKT